jgi:DNA repair exonuclease SbcCD ATPase subunit
VAGPPDEPPTRRIEPAPPPGSPREMEVVTEEPAGARAALLDELRSLKRTLALVGVIAIVALGVALWALLEQQDDGGDAQGASNERVSRLEDRVDTLEGDVEDAASDNSVSELRQQQEDLGEEVEQLSEQSSGSDAEESVQQLEQQVEELGQRVDDLEQQPDAGGEEPPP